MLSVKTYNIPAILLRSEAASSSQIEHLTASAKNVALAQIDADAPLNSRIIAANIAAMNEALSQDSPLSLDAILAIHKALLQGSAPEYAGVLRTEQVWIGSHGISPAEAVFVPPHQSRVNTCMTDLLAFMKRSDVNPIILAALSHAQFETIHPFIDGNGRCGRALLQRTLKDAGVLEHSSLPLSAGLLNNIAEYDAALNAYRAGDGETIVRTLCDAIMLAIETGLVLIERIDALLARWHESVQARKGATIWRLIDLLIANPAVDATFIEEQLKVSERTAYNVIEQAVDFGILKPAGSRKRGLKYVAADITRLIDDVVANRLLRRSRG
jgi:Fic family protein